jgi:hypothetical protein
VQYLHGVKLPDNCEPHASQDIIVIVRLLPQTGHEDGGRYGIKVLLSFSGFDCQFEYRISPDYNNVNRNIKNIKKNINIINIRPIIIKSGDKNMEEFSCLGCSFA